MGWRTVVVPGLGASLLLAGCRGFESQRAELEQYHATGRYDLAIQELESNRLKRRYGARNETLRQLDLGAASLGAGDPDGCIRALEKAERRIDGQRVGSAGATIAKWTINDAAAPYAAEPYEDMYVNVLKMLAQFKAGRISGGATVEARRLIVKTNRLRDLYLSYQEEIARETRNLLASESGGVFEVNQGLEFVESPLGTYLTAVAFMESGEQENQGVAARRLASSIELQQGLIGDVAKEPFEGLETLDPDEADVMVVALSGRGPTKYAERIGPILIGTVPIYFELPRLRSHPSEAAGARIEIDGYEPSAMALAEDLGAVATENHRRLMPMIYARTLARAAAKTIASVTLTEVARKSASDADEDWIQVLGALGGLAAIMATERADTRSWVFLPGQAHVALLDLPPGEYRMRVAYLSAAGAPVHETEWESIAVRESGLSTMVTHYWR